MKLMRIYSGGKNFLLNAMFKTYLNGLKANHTCHICGVTSVSRILVYYIWKFAYTFTIFRQTNMNFAFGKVYVENM